MAKRNFFISFIVVIISGLSTSLLAQNLGDFGTISNGRWGSSNIWRQWNGTGWSDNPNATPDSTSNVYVFHNVDFNENVVIASLNVQAGTLSFFNNGAYTIRIKGNTAIQSGAAFNLSQLNSNRTNTLILGGDLFVADNATFDMRKGNSNNQVANVTFNAPSGTQRVYSNGTPATFRFNNLTINNNASYTNSRVLVEMPFTTAGQFSIIAGTFAFTSGTLQLGTNISSTVGIEVLENATLVLPVSPSINGYLKLDGANAQVFNGSVSQPSNVGTFNVRNSGVVDLNNGLLNIWGRMTVRDNADVNVEGGTIRINNRGIVNPLPRDQSSFWVLGTASFQMTGGTIEIPNFNANTTGLPNKSREFDILSSNANLSGATIVIGNGLSTLSQASGFWMRSVAPVGNLIVNTGAAANKVIIVDELNTFTVLDSLILISGTLELDSARLSLGGNVSGNGNISFTTRTTLTLIGTESVDNLGVNNTNNVLGKLYIQKTGPFEININHPLTIERALKVGNGKLKLNNNASITILDTLEFDNEGFISGNGTLEVEGRLITRNPNGISNSNNSDVRSGVNLNLRSGSVVEYNSNSPMVVTPRQYYSVEFKGSGTKQIPAGQRIRIAGEMKAKNGNLSTRGAIIEFNGNQPQVIEAGVTIDTLHINNSTLAFLNAVSIENGNEKLRVTGKIIPGRGHLNTNGNLVLVSDSNGTASIGKPETPTAKVTGDVVFQRYLGTGSMQRLIGVPVKGATVGEIYNNDFTMVYDYYEPALGARPVGFRTLSATDSIIPGAGYYVEGGRPNTTTEYVGEVFDGTCHYPGVTFTVDPANRGASGWILVTNPYPSVIDWDAVTGWTRNNISTTIFYVNPETGQQISYNNGVGVNGASRYISPGQGFWVKAFGSFPTLISSENVKADANPRFFRTASDAGNILRIRLTTAKASDETVVRLHEDATHKVDPNLDAERMPLPMHVENPASWISTCAQDEQLMTINSIPNHIDAHTKIQMASWFSEVGNATISVDLSQFDTKGLDVFIEDTRTRVFHNLSKNPQYTFDVRPSEIQKELKRFVIHFRTPGSEADAHLFSDIQVYPNPSNGVFSLQTMGITGAANVRMISLTGAVVYEAQVNEMQLGYTRNFEMSHLPSGVYFMNIENEGKMYSVKVNIR